MPARRRKDPDPRNVLREISPVLSIIAAVCGIVVWSFQTFAQLSYVKENNQQLQQLIEQRHAEALKQSDDNRDRLLSTMTSLKDSMKTLETRIYELLQNQQEYRLKHGIDK